VQRALKGLVVMSGELEAMGNAMVVGGVPKLWAAVGYPSLKPLGPWVVDLLLRLVFLKEWVAAKKAPSVFWISGFFFTQSFLTGTLQNYARKHTLPIDGCSFDYRVLTPSECTTAKTTDPDDGAYIRGLFLDGCRWSNEIMALAESLPRELFTSLPFVHMMPKEDHLVPKVIGDPALYTGDLTGTAHVYAAPVYKTSERRGILMTTGHST